MKRVQLSIAAIAAVAGITSALAFTPHHSRFGAPVYAELTGTTFHYFNSKPLDIASCKDETGYACSFTSTATAAFFNGSSLYQSTFPSSQSVGPQISVSTTDKIYLPL